MQIEGLEKLSIVVPVYNVEKYLDNTITHIQNQTYSNLEILLVDDGSTDTSGRICEEYAKKDSRIRVIHKKNGGSSSARNCGIKAATGAYIGFLDADDYADETMYEVLYRTLKETGGTVAQVMSRDFDEEGNLLKDAYRSSGKVCFLSKQEMFRLLMLHEGDSSFCTKLVKADFMKQFRFQEKKLNEDFELILRMLLHTEGFYSIEEAHYNILIRQGSNQRSGFKPQLYEAVIDNSDMAFAMMEQNFPQFRTETERFFYLQRLDYLLHLPVEQMRKENKYYQKVLGEIRKGKAVWSNNPFLKKKEKRNLKILCIFPKLSKRVHGIFMRIKSVKN